MGIFNRDKYVLWNIEEKEIVWEGKELLSKEAVQQDIEDENLEDTLYRMEIWSGGRKVRNAWVMRKARKKSSPEELAEKSREEAEAFIAKDAQDIKDRVEAHKAFALKVRETYGIEGGAVDKIEIPTGKDGTLGILEAAQIAVAQSTYEGIRKTRPEEVAASFKSVMDSGTTILAGIAQMLTARMVESKKPKVKKEVVEKKEEVKKPEPKKEEVKTHKEDLGDGKTKVTFGSDASTDPTYHFQKTDTTTTSSDIHKLPVTYEEYKKDMLVTEEEFDEESETEEEHTRRKFEEM